MAEGQKYIRYSEVFNNLGVLEMSAGVTTVVLSIIALAVAPKYSAVPIVDLQASFLICGMGVIGLVLHSDSPKTIGLINVIVSPIGVFDLLGSCIVSITLAVKYLENTYDSLQLKDGVIAIYIMNALIFFLGGSVLVIHSVYAIKGLR